MPKTMHPDLFSSHTSRAPLHSSVTAVYSRLRSYKCYLPRHHLKWKIVFPDTLQLPAKVSKPMDPENTKMNVFFFRSCFWSEMVTTVTATFREVRFGFTCLLDPRSSWSYVFWTQDCPQSPTSPPPSHAWSRCTSQRALGLIDDGRMVESRCDHMIHDFRRLDMICFMVSRM